MADTSPGLMRHSDVPFCSLGFSTRHLLAWQLNPKRECLSPTTRRLQDWRGLADVFGLSQIDVDNFELKDNPTVELLSVWSRLNPLATIGMFLQALLEIERYDVLHLDTFQAAVGQLRTYIFVLCVQYSWV